MTTPPTGEDPHRGPSPDESPPPPQAAPHGQPPQFGQQPPFAQQPSFAQQPQYGQPTVSGQQPQYGQPPGYPRFGQQPPPAWQPGPPQAPPRDKTRRRLIVALELVALALVVGLATLVYVLSSTILDRTAVESDVAAQFEEREGVALDLECDERMIVRPGADYECEGTTADGEDVEILITVNDESGAYTWAED